jgi:hypothetical protein
MKLIKSDFIMIFMEKEKSILFYLINMVIISEILMNILIN